MTDWNQSDGSDLVFPDVLNIEPPIMQVELDTVGSEECNASSGIWSTDVSPTLGIYPECVTPAIIIANDDAKKSAPTRKRSFDDLEKVDERKRKRILQNRASAERSRTKQKERMQDLELLCEKQYKEILCLRKQLNDVVNTVDE
jgi:hypothetical protein